MNNLSNNGKQTYAKFSLSQGTLAEFISCDYRKFALNPHNNIGNAICDIHKC